DPEQEAHVVVSLILIPPSPTLARPIAAPAPLPRPATIRDAGQLTGPASGPAVRGQNVVQRHLGPTGPIMLRDYPGHRIDDSCKPEPSPQERLDADLVGGVIDGRGRPALGPHLAGERHRGERGLVQRLEGPGLRRGPVHRACGAWNPVGPG